MKHLKNLLLSSIIFLLIIGCGARKVDMHKTYEKESTEISVKETKKNDIESKTDVKKQESTDSKTVTESGKVQKTEESEFSIVIEPTAENPKGEYDININGKNIKGTTNSKITITNKKKKDSIKTDTKTEDNKNVKKQSDSTGTIKDKSQSDLKIDSESDKVNKDKTKITDKKESWVFNVLGIAGALFVIIALFLIIKFYINKYRLKG